MLGCSHLGQANKIKHTRVLFPHKGKAVGKVTSKSETRHLLSSPMFSEEWKSIGSSLSILPNGRNTQEVWRKEENRRVIWMEIRGKKNPAPWNSKPKVSQIWRAWKLHRILEWSYTTILATPFLVALFQGKGSFGCKGRSCLLLPNHPTGSILLLLKEATVWCWSLVASSALPLLWLHQLPVQKFRQFISAPKKPTFSFNYQGSRATRKRWKPIDRRKTHVQQNPDFPIEEETETQSTIPYVWSCTSQDTQRWSEMVISEREICEMMVWERGDLCLQQQGCRHQKLTICRNHWHPAHFFEFPSWTWSCCCSDWFHHPAGEVVVAGLKEPKCHRGRWELAFVWDWSCDAEVDSMCSVMDGLFWTACSPLKACCAVAAVVDSRKKNHAQVHCKKKSCLKFFASCKDEFEKPQNQNLAKTRNLETTQTKKAWLKQS